MTAKNPRLRKERQSRNSSDNSTTRYQGQRTRKRKSAVQSSRKTCKLGEWRESCTAGGIDAPGFPRAVGSNLRCRFDSWCVGNHQDFHGDPGCPPPPGGRDDLYQALSRSAPSGIRGFTKVVRHVEKEAARSTFSRNLTESRERRFGIDGSFYSLIRDQDDGPCQDGRRRSADIRRPDRYAACRYEKDIDASFSRRCSSCSPGLCAISHVQRGKKVEWTTEGGEIEIDRQTGTRGDEKTRLFIWSEIVLTMASKRLMNGKERINRPVDM